MLQIYDQLKNNLFFTVFSSKINFFNKKISSRNLAKPWTYTLIICHENVFLPHFCVIDIATLCLKAMKGWLDCWPLRTLSAGWPAWARTADCRLDCCRLGCCRLEAVAEGLCTPLNPANLGERKVKVKRNQLRFL